MVDWVAGTADASAADRDVSFLPLRVSGSPDVFKETPVTAFVVQDASGNYSTPAGSGAGIKVSYSTANAGSRSWRFKNDVNVFGDFALQKSTTQTGNTFIDVINFNAAGIAAFVSDITTSVGSGGAFEIKYTLANASSRSWRLKNDVNVFGDLCFQQSSTQTGSVFVDKLTIDNNGHVKPGGDNAQALGGPSNRWSVVYSATGAINTSDERAKEEISEMPEAWLDAWADVQWQRFKMIDGVRWHVGLVAQQVHAAFAAYDIDAFEIGLCCFDEWPEKIDSEELGIITETRDRWGLRYDECQALEAAWQRRELARMAARITALEA